MVLSFVDCVLVTLYIDDEDDTKCYLMSQIYLVENFKIHRGLTFSYFDCLYAIVAVSTAKY